MTCFTSLKRTIIFKTQPACSDDSRGLPPQNPSEPHSQPGSGPPQGHAAFLNIQNYGDDCEPFRKPSSLRSTKARPSYYRVTFPWKRVFDWEAQGILSLSKVSRLGGSWPGFGMPTPLQTASSLKQNTTVPLRKLFQQLQSKGGSCNFPGFLPVRGAAGPLSSPAPNSQILKPFLMLLSLRLP